MKTFEECWWEVFDRDLDAHAKKAAELYRNESLKGLLEEVRFASNQWQAKSDNETDNASKAAYSTIAYAVGRIGKRIEELISSSQRQENDDNQSGN